MRRCAASLIALTALSSASLGAQPVAAGVPVPGSTLIDFNALAAGTPVTTQFAAIGVVISGGACANPDASAFNFGGDRMQVANFVGGGPETPGVSCTPGGPVAQPITFTFARPITFFGLNATGNVGVAFRFDDGNGQVTLPFTPLGGAPFIGIQDARPFTAVTISAADRSAFYVIFDDLRFTAAATAVVPEPATLLLVGLGLALGGGVATRQVRQRRA